MMCLAIMTEFRRLSDSRTDRKTDKTDRHRSDSISSASEPSVASSGKNNFSMWIMVSRYEFL